MTSRHHRSAVVALVAALLAVLAGPWTQEAGATTSGASGDSWRTLLERAVEASRASAYRGELVVAAFGAGGPTLAEVAVAQGIGGRLRVGNAEAWMVGRDADDAFFWQPQAGTLLRLGNVERTELSLTDLTTKYAVDLGDPSALVTGPSQVVVLRERGAEDVRERLFVDEATGLVVRRETFDGQGEAVRVVAFTELEATDLELDLPEATETIERGPGRALEHASLEILGRVGWAVPAQLPTGFRLRSGYALPEGDGSSLHLVYSDGLYTLSVYEQFGRLSAEGRDGAVEVTGSGTRVWHWADAEPERLVWTGDGKTFTAVSDAPLDTVLAAVGAFPAPQPRGILGRLGRGLSRVGTWAWPFD